MVVSTSLWLHLHCKRAFVPHLDLLQRQLLVSRRNNADVVAVSIADVDGLVRHAAVKRRQPARTKASHEAVGSFDLRCLIVFVAAVLVAKAAVPCTRVEHPSLSLSRPAVAG